MLTLAINCAGQSCDVALLRDGQLIAERQEAMKRGHDQRLPILTQELLSETGISLKEIEQFAVCVGPGSFTGIRVGVAFVRGLALANGVSAIGVTSLEAMTTEAAGASLLVAMPARKRQPDRSFWIQALTDDEKEEPEEISEALLPDYLKNFPLAETVVITPDTLSSEAEALFPAAKAYVAGYSSAKAVGMFAYQDAAGNPRPAVPIYAREPDAVPANSAKLFNAAPD